jgi:hypothetical protein
MEKKPEPTKDLKAWERANAKLRQEWDVGTPEATEAGRDKEKKPGTERDKRER